MLRGLLKQESGTAAVRNRALHCRCSLVIGWFRLLPQALFLTHPSLFFFLSPLCHSISSCRWLSFLILPPQALRDRSLIHQGRVRSFLHTLEGDGPPAPPLQRPAGQQQELVGELPLWAIYEERGYTSTC